MATLVVGLTMLVCAAAWASCASEGAWLAFFESISPSECPGDEAEEERPSIHGALNTAEASRQVDRITALPSLHKPEVKVRVVK
jgi:hypothetical protein